MFPLKERYLDEDWGGFGSSSSHICNSDTDLDTKDLKEDEKSTINYGQLMEEEYEMRFNLSPSSVNQVDKPSFLKDFFKSFFHL